MTQEEKQPQSDDTDQLQEQEKTKGVFFMVSSWLGFFLSVSTLFCCTLPIILVTLGMGANLVGILKIFPWLNISKDQAFWFFLGSGVYLIFNYFQIFRERNTYCAIDGGDFSAGATKCNQLMKMSQKVFYFSFILWCLGFFSAYLSGPIAFWIWH